MAMHPIVGYWAGYQPDGNTLDQTPPYATAVTLFVAAPYADGTVDTNYLCKVYPAAEQIRWAHELQMRGTEVLMSFMDTSKVHWNAVDPVLFAQSVKSVVIDEWGLNGVCFDLESGMPSDVWVDTFVKLIQAMRAELGPKGSTSPDGKPIARITAVGYQPTDDLDLGVLKAAGMDLDWFDTMAYFDDAQGQESLYADYAPLVESVNVGIGVCYQNGQSTPLSVVEDVAAFLKDKPTAGFMEFLLNNDCEHYTKEPQWTWFDAMNKDLNS